MDRLSSKQKLDELRRLMKEYFLDYYIIPHGDQHFSEFIPESEERIKYLSGFSGSAGTIIVSMSNAYLWTDGRYHIQADQEVDLSIWTVMKYQQPGILHWEDWIKKESEQVKSNHNIGFDPVLFSPEQVEKKNFVAIDQNLVDIIWNTNESKRFDSSKKKELFVLSDEYSGETYQSKKTRLSEVLHTNYMIITQLEDIAWLLNLRGFDMECTPVFYVFMIINSNSSWLFVDTSKLNDDVKKYLELNSVNVISYDKFYDELSLLKNQTVIYDPSETNYKIKSILKKNVTLVKQKSPIKLMKSIKNHAERTGMRQCHIRDGLALTRFLAWLENKMKQKSDEQLNEVTLSDKLKEFRQLNEKFICLSFPTISSVGPNSAIIHYQPSPSKCSEIKSDIYLCDSGGQYFDGTTDVTRTVHLGEPTKEQIRNYTLVLKGHIALGMTKFPKGITGVHLDALARQYLWNDNKDYCHSTGHGVGHCLGVHEYPPYIGKSLLNGGNGQLAPGMVVSNEPGYYENGKYGIRIESLIMVETINNSDEFMQFETLTVVPMERKLIDVSLLDSSHISWLNAYHQKCWDLLSPLIIDLNDDLALKWLEVQCTPFN